MLEQMTTAGLSELLNTATITLLVGNILYIFYVFAKKRVYYDKLLLTFAIYFFDNGKDHARLQGRSA